MAGLRELEGITLSFRERKNEKKEEKPARFLFYSFIAITAPTPLMWPYIRQWLHNIEQLQL